MKTMLPARTLQLDFHRIHSETPDSPCHPGWRTVRFGPLSLSLWHRFPRTDSWTVFAPAGLHHTHLYTCTGVGAIMVVRSTVGRSCPPYHVIKLLGLRLTLRSHTSLGSWVEHRHVQCAFGPFYALLVARLCAVYHRISTCIKRRN